MTTGTSASRPRSAAIAVAALVAAACSSSSSTRSTGSHNSSTPATPTSAAKPPATTVAAAAPASPCLGGPAPAVYDHVIWIWMENHTASEVIGPAPFQTQLVNECATATDYHTVGSPSAPNYIGATSGDTFGISDDGYHPLGADNLFRQVPSRSYEESMPTNCDLASRGEYALKHNPQPYYTGANDRTACGHNDIPFTGFLADVAADRLAPFDFVTPNLCDDTHDCSVSTGDAWLHRVVPPILQSASYLAGRTAVIIVYDEYTPMPNVFIARSVRPGQRDRQRVDHYALLRTTEDMLGVRNYLGHADTAPDLRAAFNL